MLKNILSLRLILAMYSVFLANHPASRAADQPTLPSRAATAAPLGRDCLSFNNDWSFALGRDPVSFDPGRGADWGPIGALAKVGWGYQTLPMKPTIVRLPHDWAVGLTPTRKGIPKNAFVPLGLDFPETSIGWYWRSFAVPASDEGRRLWLEFDAVFRNAGIWINGIYLGVHEPGYEAFRYDITDMVNPGGNNRIVVRVDATQKEGWWYEGAGIYGDVRLIKTHPVAVAPDGVFVRTDFPGNNSAATPEVRISSTVQNHERKAIDVVVNHTIENSKGGKVATASTKATVQPGADLVVDAGTKVQKPELWSTETPTLYQLITQVVVDGKVTDEVRTPFGFRTIEFNATKGFLLNGQRLILKGVCLHHDYPVVGTAMTESMHRYRLEVIKSFGANAIRMAHNPPIPALLKLCDQMGILVMDEVRSFGSAPYALAQVRSMVTRDRNHPSVIIWSIGNEEPFESSVTGERMGRTVVDYIQQLDPTRLTTEANAHSEKHVGVNSVVGVHGINYGRFDTGWVSYHADYPDIPTVITEVNANHLMRGDPTKPETANKDYDRVTGWRMIEANPWISGVFIWSGFSYGGEVNASSWPEDKEAPSGRNSNYGIVSRCGFRSELTWKWQSIWLDRPLVHLLLPKRGWSGKPGEKMSVPIVCNGDEVELLLNGRSLGKRPLPVVDGTHPIQGMPETLDWQVPFEAGTLEAKSYKAGRVVASDRSETPGPATAIRLELQQPNPAATWEQRILVNAYRVDAKGIVVADEKEDRPIHFSVEGPGSLMGATGDTRGLAMELVPTVALSNGVAQAVISASPTAGQIRVRAEIEGLPKQEIVVTTVPVPLVPEVPLGKGK